MKSASMTWRAIPACPYMTEWSDLDAGCEHAEIILSGADQQSGTYELMGESIFPSFGQAAGDENFRGLQAGADNSSLVQLTLTVCS